MPPKQIWHCRHFVATALRLPNLVFDSCSQRLQSNTLFNPNDFRHCLPLASGGGISHSLRHSLHFSCSIKEKPRVRDGEIHTSTLLGLKALYKDQ